MPRSKVTLAFITNDATRKATYMKRKKGLLQKARELATLCAINICAIIYSAYEPQPEVWPSVPEANRVISKLKGMSQMQQNHKMMNQESYIKQRIVKVKEQLKKQIEKNHKKEMKEVVYRCLVGATVKNFNLEELNYLERVLDENLKEISKSIEMLDLGEGSKNEEVVNVGKKSPNVGFSMEAMTQRFNDSVSIQNGQMDFDGGIVPYGDNINATRSGSVFPRE